MPQIDWAHFTPLAALVGGGLIGLAAGALLILNGRILGISGILGGLLAPKSGDVRWRAWFIAGLLLPPLVLGATGYIAPPMKTTGSVWGLIVAGLLVGFGTRMGSGCTSGHGICGMARLSPRSIAATVTFLLTGFVTVYLVRHVL